MTPIDSVQTWLAEASPQFKARMAGVFYVSPGTVPLAHYLRAYNLAPGALEETSLILRLLVIGANAQQCKKQASTAGERQ